MSDKIQIETNIDNMNPEYYSDLLEGLLALGANDAWLAPIIMKKGRPAITLSVLCTKQLLTEVARFIFTHTTSIGIRYTVYDRITCERWFTTIQVDDCIVHKKTASFEEKIVNESYEFDDLKALAEQKGCSVKQAEYLVRAKEIEKMD